MPTNDKWGALSMRDRAFLIREAVLQGITKLPYIRDLYNKVAPIDTSENNTESTKNIPKTAGYVDLEEIKRRQAWAESKFKDNARSPAGAVGRFQIMPQVQADYIKAGGRKGDLTDPKYNEEVRDWQMEQLAKRPWIDKEESTDSVKVGKQLAAYNYGPTSLVHALNKAKAAGIDIYKSFDWVDEAYLPKETADYVNWTLRNKPTGSHRNDTVYNANKHKYSGEEDSFIGTVLELFNSTKRKIADKYYSIIYTPKDYSGETTTELDCAKWSNKQLQKKGYDCFGHAWTRRDNDNLTPIFSGYNTVDKPKKYDEEAVRNYLFNAADSVKSGLDPSVLKDDDIVGLFYRGSGSQHKAFQEGVKGEAHTHTGHIEFTDGIPYVLHNIHGDIVKNKVSDLLGSDKPYGITSIHRLSKRKNKK